MNPPAVALKQEDLVEEATRYVASDVDAYSHEGRAMASQGSAQVVAWHTSLDDLPISTNLALYSVLTARMATLPSETVRRPWISRLLAAIEGDSPERRRVRHEKIVERQAKILSRIEDRGDRVFRDMADSLGRKRGSS